MSAALLARLQQQQRTTANYVRADNRELRASQLAGKRLHARLYLVRDYWRAAELMARYPS